MNFEISEYVLTSWHSHFFGFPTSSVLSPPTGRNIKSEPEWKSCATAAVRIQPLFCNYSTLERGQQKRQGSFLVVIQSVGHVELKQKTKKTNQKIKKANIVSRMWLAVFCLCNSFMETHTHAGWTFLLDSNFQPDRHQNECQLEWMKYCNITVLSNDFFFIFLFSFHLKYRFSLCRHTNNAAHLRTVERAEHSWGGTKLWESISAHFNAWLELCLCCLPFYSIIQVSKHCPLLTAQTLHWDSCVLTGRHKTLGQHKRLSQISTPVSSTSRRWTFE